MATHKRRAAATDSAVAPEPIVILRYFLSSTWTQRLTSCIASRTSTEGRDFALANVNRLNEHLSFAKSLRVVFNIGAHALLNYLRSGDCQNIYEEPITGGKRRHPSETRIEADSLVGISPVRDYYFCALASGGSGIRYYGEYCAVIDPGAASTKAAVSEANKVLLAKGWNNDPSRDRLIAQMLNPNAPATTSVPSPDTSQSGPAPAS